MTDHSSLREACGVFGIYAPGEDVARLTFYGIYALQHRGQESAGIATSDGKNIHLRTGMGLVAQVFDESDLPHLSGHMAIGHTRYSTTGSSHIVNAQPLQVNGACGPMALGHNGNLVNSEALRRQLEEQGVVFQTSTDSEIIAHLLAGAPGNTWEERLRHTMRRLEGAYCLVILTPDAIIAIRDPLGVRPLSLGLLNGNWVVASETCALDHLGAEFVREVEPGEAVYIDENGLTSIKTMEETRHALCLFEFIYFSRPDSLLKGKLIHPVRMAMGAQLAREHPIDADIVTGVPDSATAAAIGYANESGIPYVEALVKNRYVGRTFIQPDQRIRELGVHLKFNPLREVLEGKRVVVVDDSIVRGTTTPRIIELLRRAGAREVHMRICAPPIRHPCHFGIDMATQWELIAAQKSVPEIREHIAADTLGYLSLEGLAKAIGLPQEEFCNACFTGKYPIPVQLQMDKLVFEHNDSSESLIPAGEGWDVDRRR